MAGSIDVTPLDRTLQPKKLFTGRDLDDVSGIQKRNFLQNVGVVSKVSCSFYPCNAHRRNVKFLESWGCTYTTPLYTKTPPLAVFTTQWRTYVQGIQGMPCPLDLGRPCWVRKGALKTCRYVCIYGAPSIRMRPSA